LRVLQKLQASFLKEVCMKVLWDRSIPLIIVLACAALPNTALGQDPNAHIFLAHALPGRLVSSTTHPAYPIDIAIDKTCLVQQLDFGDLRGPFTFSPGSHTVTITIANALSPCGGALAFSGGIAPVAGQTQLGVVYLNAGRPFALVTNVDLSTVPAGVSRVMMVNISTQSLTAAFTLGDSTGGTAAKLATIPPGTSIPFTQTSGQYSLTVYPQGSTTRATGPIEADLVSRNVHIYVLAGSTTNNSVQVVGPIMIKDVL
jgi:hypothetical protein